MSVMTNRTAPQGNMNEKTKAQFTPGPWKLHFWSENIGVGSDRAKARECESIATLPRHIENGAHNDRALRAEADARLIAAAPDLLAACEMALAILRFASPANRRTEAMLEAAIAAARGGK